MKHVYHYFLNLILLINYLKALQVWLSRRCLTLINNLILYIYEIRLLFKLPSTEVIHCVLNHLKNFFFSLIIFNQYINFICFDK